MITDDGRCSGRGQPANDNRPPDVQETVDNANASDRVDKVVLTVVRLIGRSLAWEDHEKAMCAANDNAPEAGDEHDGEDA